MSDFVKQGYLTDALINFVALLGWSPSDGVEIKSVDEIAADFRIHEVSSSNSVFEYDKLNWMNGQYIKKMEIPKLTDMILPFLSKYDTAQYDRKKLEKIVEITREPLTVLSQIEHDASYFFEDKINLDEVKEVVEKDSSKEVIKYVLDNAQSWNFDDEEDIHNKLGDLRAYFKENKGLKPKDTMWAVRAALTGRTRGADMAETVWILGKERVLKRLAAAL